MKHFIIPALMLLSLSSQAQTQKATKPKTSTGSTKLVTQVESIEEFHLPNGLQVLLIPDATQNNALVNIVYKVGSRHEGYGESGMAHLLEHMLFKGTKNIKDIKKSIADKGAQANGTTWYDRTNYYEIFPSSDDNLKWALSMEAERMVNSLIQQSDLDKEFSVVRNEFESGENNPQGILEERVLSTMFLWHNYGKSTIGSKEDIEKVPATSLKAFYQKYYQPDNATLIVAGKFDKAKTLGWIQQYFAPIPKPNRQLIPTYTVEPTQDGERTVELRRNGDIQFVGVGFHTPSYADKDFVANQALIEILSNEPSGLLYRALVEKKLATKVGGYCLPLLDPGFTYFNAEIPKDINVKEAKAAFLKAFNDLANLNITKEDLERAKNALTKENENLYNNTIYFGINLTEVIGAGSYKLWFLNRDRIEQLTVNDIKTVAKKYYKKSNRTVGTFIPDKAADRTEVAATPNIDQLTKEYKGRKTNNATESFETSITNIKSKTTYGQLKNGMKYALLPKPTKGDKIVGTMMLKMGNLKSLENKADIAYLTAKMLKTGTATRTRKNINDELDQLKSSIDFYGSANTLNINLNTDKEHFSKVMDLLSDLLLHPSFDAQEFDKLILETKGELEASLSDPGNLANEVFAKKVNLYPKNHPLYSSSSKEQLESIKSITVMQLKSFYKDFYGCNNGFASFVGAIDSKSTESALTKYFSNWNSASPYADLEEKYFDVKGGVELVQVNDKSNATLMGGININLTQKDADYLPLYMANEMLGGGAFLSSRIPQRLREAEGMSYGAGSYYSANYKYPSGSIGFYAIFNPSFQQKLNDALLEEINKALKDGFTEKEWKSSLDSWLQQRKLSLNSNGSLAGLLNKYMFEGKDLTFYSELETKAQQLKLKDINNALKKYLDTNKIVLIYAGDFRKK